MVFTEFKMALCPMVESIFELNRYTRLSPTLSHTTTLTKFRWVHRSSFICYFYYIRFNLIVFISACVWARVFASWSAAKTHKNRFMITIRPNFVSALFLKYANEHWFLSCSIPELYTQRHRKTKMNDNALRIHISLNIMNNEWINE